MTDRGDAPGFDELELFRQMARARALEEASVDLWERGLIAGELHTGIGEEAVAAGVLAHLRAGDAVVADHRPSAPFTVWGVDPTAMLAEMLGAPTGLGRGHGGHMHLLDRDRRAVSDGIVGASGPAACGFALESQQHRTGGVAVALFGEGATNQGMLMEAFNLAAVWRLPVVFVCKDSSLAITTRRSSALASSPGRKAAAHGLPVRRGRGNDVRSVWRAARSAVAHARAGRGPSFVSYRVHRPQGHLLGDPLIRPLQDPIGQAVELGGPLVESLRAPSDAPLRWRVAGVTGLGRAVAAEAREVVWSHRDPLVGSRRRIGDAEADALEAAAVAEMAAATVEALAQREATGG